MIVFLWLLRSYAGLIGTSEHAIYLGIVQVQQEAGRNIASLKIKAFADDLQSAVRNQFPKTYHPAAGEEFLTNNSKNIEGYFISHLSIHSDNEVWILQLSGWALENDVVILTFNTSCPETVKNLSVKVDFFMELFPTQSNIIHLEIAGHKKYARTTKVNPVVEFEVR